MQSDGESSVEFSFFTNITECVILVFQEKTREDSRECERLKELLGQRTAEYIEEVLAPHFGGMLTFVRETDHFIANNNTEALKDYESKFLHPCLWLVEVI